MKTLKITAKFSIRVPDDAPTGPLINCLGAFITGKETSTLGDIANGDAYDIEYLPGASTDVTYKYDKPTKKKTTRRSKGSADV
jgi:hypothetical protein